MGTCYLMQLTYWGFAWLQGAAPGERKKGHRKGGYKQGNNLPAPPIFQCITTK